MYILTTTKARVTNTCVDGEPSLLIKSVYKINNNTYIQFTARNMFS